MLQHAAIAPRADLPVQGGAKQHKRGQTARRKASSRLSHFAIWFQLANVWLTTFREQFCHF
jgi:cell division protein FtsB